MKQRDEKKEKKRMKILGIVITVFGALFYAASCILILFAFKGIQAQEPFLSGWGKAEPAVIAQTATPLVLGNVGAISILFTGLLFLYESKKDNRREN